MCFWKAFGTAPFRLRIHTITCKDCGCTEGWKEIEKEYLVQCKGHIRIPRLGLFDEVIMLEYTAWCPACESPIHSHYLDCDREAVATAEVEIPEEVYVYGEETEESQDSGLFRPRRNWLDAELQTADD
jgi:hypothetical protein